ncbi:hypothetical protein NECAME_06340 [Necator americanus]|uniref:Uncharacterized protein n=1 Tax=Necator americanus TaxID=51031 RepID=W2TUI0_NECAM|nr:hypothetical protein NECAME_06340 [Necator americanus]ETN85473.1 hypothetical protein NECAME_06340 [Necator americanus]
MNVGEILAGPVPPTSGYYSPHSCMNDAMSADQPALVAYDLLKLLSSTYLIVVFESGHAPRSDGGRPLPPSANDPYPMYRPKNLQQ